MDLIGSLWSRLTPPSARNRAGRAWRRAGVGAPPGRGGIRGPWWRGSRRVVSASEPTRWRFGVVFTSKRAVCGRFAGVFEPISMQFMAPGRRQALCGASARGDHERRPVPGLRRLRGGARGGVLGAWNALISLDFVMFLADFGGLQASEGLKSKVSTTANWFSSSLWGLRAPQVFLIDGRGASGARCAFVRLSNLKVRDAICSSVPVAR